MASPQASSRPSGTDGLDDLDDLFNYDVGDENDPFSDNYKPAVPIDTAREPTNKSSKNAAGLGIDEEVEVTKKIRAPRVKLDEHRLLSAAGIPKLRRRAKDHLKFKGKGHEYSDAARLLAFYQLWLDDLFPKARFLDALAMVEKAGHKRQMQSMRMEWINEGRPKSSVHEDSIFDQPPLPRRENDEREKTATRIAPIFEKTASERPKTPVREVDADAEMDNLYDATPRPLRPTQGAADSEDSLFGGRTTIPKPVNKPVADDGPDEDELDALLAEEEMMQAEQSMQAKSTGVKFPPAASKAPAPQDDDFDDDMAAMAEMDGLW